MVADALSRCTLDDAHLHTMSAPTFQLFDDLRVELAASEELGRLGDTISESRGPEWTMIDGLIHRGCRTYVPASSQYLDAVLQLAHTAGHEGIQKTLHCLCRDFIIDDDQRVVRDFVRSCLKCQQNKTEHLQPAGLLNPLEVPSKIWSDISLDFVEALLKVNGKSVILTMVDRFSKDAHFIPLGHRYTTTSVARAFFTEIVRFHGFPSSIVSDRDPVFTCHVWRDLFKLAGVQLKMSTTFHPQTDGQSEAVNKTISMYLPCITGDRPRAWLEWLPWAEYCYNTSYHSALRATPFQVVYGREPPPLLAYALGSARTDTMDTMLQNRDTFLAEVRTRLLQAQAYAKKYYDADHRPLEFPVDSWVWLRMLHRPTQSLLPGKRGQLGPHYVGPFKVLERIGNVDYRLQLPAGAHIHDVFHVGLLKPFHGAPPASTPALPPTQHGRRLPDPEHVLQSQLRRGSWFVLIKWAGLHESEATWEAIDDFRTTYPALQLEDKLFP